MARPSFSSPSSISGLEEYDERPRIKAKKALDVNPAFSAKRFLSSRRRSFSCGNDAAFSSEIELRALASETRGMPISTTSSPTSRCNNRLYHRAVGVRRRKRWSSTTARGAGYGLLGVNQLRLGDIEEGTKPVSSARSKAIRTTSGTRTRSICSIRFVDYVTTPKPSDSSSSSRGQESELLAVYFAKCRRSKRTTKLVEALRLPSRKRPSASKSSRRTGIFRSRTLGLPGLGALGVCFGPVIAVDSPSARPERRSSTGRRRFWHELAHTFTLGVTDHQVPRWFSEGLSVLEERRARPGLGRRRQSGFSRRLPARASLLNDRRAQQRLHETDLPAADRDLLLPSVARLRAHRAGLTSFQAIRDMLAGLPH